MNLIALPDPQERPPRSKCHHLSMTGKTLENVDLLICDNDQCAHIEAHCRHVKCSWNDDGSVLTCDFCGVDGT